MVGKSPEDSFRERIKQQQQQQREEDSDIYTRLSELYPDLSPTVIDVAVNYYPDIEGQLGYLEQCRKSAQRRAAPDEPTTPTETVPIMSKWEALRELEEVAKEARRSNLYAGEINLLSNWEAMLLATFVINGYFSIHKVGWREGLGPRYRASAVVVGRRRSNQFLVELGNVFRGRVSYGKKGTHNTYLAFERADVVRRICFLLRIGELDLPTIMVEQIPIIEEFLSAEMPRGRPRDRKKRDRIYEKRRKLYQEFLETKKTIKNKVFIDMELQDPRDSE